MRCRSIFFRIFSAGCPSRSNIAIKKKGDISPIIKSIAAELPIGPRVKKYTGRPIAPAMLKQTNWRRVRPKATLVFMRVRSLGTGT